MEITSKSINYYLSCSQAEFVKSVRIRSYCGPNFPAFGLNTEIRLRVSPYSVRMQENADQNNPEYEHFLRSASKFITSSYKQSTKHYHYKVNINIYKTLWRQA